MPNHIDNNILIVAEPELVKQIRSEIGSDEIDSSTGQKIVIDFEKVLPMPSELDNTTSPSEEPNQELIDKYGYDNWYDWRVNNWGTKWDAYSQVNIDEDKIFFQTAWAHPVEIMIALSKKYPKAIFVSTFADEDTGHNCGIVAYKDGESHFVDGSAKSNSNYFGIAFATCVNYGYDFDETIEEYYEPDEVIEICKYIESDDPRIKIAKELSVENAQPFIDELLK